MKTVIRSVAILLASLCAQAATISLNPVPLAKAIHAKASPSTRARRISGALLVGLTVADYRTTMRGIDRGFCETNPFLLRSRCVLNEPKFTALKAGTIGFVVAQELPIWRRHQESWNRLFLIGNIAASAPLAVGVMNNYRLLAR